MKKGYEFVLKLGKKTYRVTSLSLTVEKKESQEDIVEKRLEVTILTPTTKIFEWAMISSILKNGVLEATDMKTGKPAPEEHIYFRKGRCASIRIKYKRIDADPLSAILTIKAEHILIGKETFNPTDRNWN